MRSLRAVISKGAPAEKEVRARPRPAERTKLLVRSLQNDFVLADSGRGVLREKEEERSDDGTREGHYSEAKPNGRSRKTTNSEAYSSAQRRPFASQNIFTRSVKDILRSKTELPVWRRLESP